MNTWKNAATDDLCDVILSLRNREECYAFLEDICTIREVLDISQRLSVVRRLHRGDSYMTISHETGASTATISRVAKSLSYGSGGYQLILSRCENNLCDKKNAAASDQTEKAEKKKETPYGRKNTEK